LFTKFNKKWFVVVTSLLLVTAVIFTACSSTTTTTNTTTTAIQPTSTTTTQFSALTSTTPTATVVTSPTNTTTTAANTTTTSTTATAVATTSSPVVALNGAGGTFPAPLYSQWFSTYASVTGVQVNYQAVGSGAGITAITNNTVDFGASDAIMTSAQVTAAQAAGGPLLTIPTTMGAVAIAYNLVTLGAGQQLKLTGPVLANIYLKNITYWDDAAISGLNPGLNLPHAAIAVVHRSDSSGTSYIFTNYLSQVSQQWSTQVGTATSVNWPGDVGGSGTAGVAADVQQIGGSIGYIELAYAVQNNIPYALMQNSSGNYIAPSVASASAAADGVTLPANMLIMITNSSNPTAYPITGFTWLLVYQNQTNQVKGQELVNLLWWILTSAQKYNNALTYPMLPASAVTIAEAEVNSIAYNGQALHHN
jgi:phosphate transport system substrate-binding protein